ncbi:amino acid adenylation domain-containing protein [Kineococcus xinjiangensis]|uniref:Amino acid adenylation domain-containing protein n=1 Tax=Kineococcus xinjiangensis TaxID=512762 RepID=A0A2S6IWR4_9ACTN|nr:hybrid non-ribosomal peptide synthetase/type I polyketide synthase [Kineococcus xinjiangensis]PPK98725.1 amino acid adenylation domain-containing protein [Kineococcus xinjiangensis]
MSRDGTLLDVLLNAAEVAPEQVVVRTAADGDERVLRYDELLQESLRVAGGLRTAGAEPGSPVIVLAGAGTDFLTGFWGALAAGLVPVPLAPVPAKVAAVWAQLGRPPLLAGADVTRPPGHLPGAGAPSGPRMLALDELRLADPLSRVHRPDAADVAFLQFSSGSTGAPKGVVLSHANVVANLRQARAAGAVTESDVMVSWLPYSHDMGLIGAHLTPLSLQLKQVKLDPADFGARPALWYEAAARHGATLLPMASFALALTVRRVTAEEVAALDLRSVRLVGVGAEPIPVPMWRAFSQHMRPSGLRPSALAPLYGLAEATLAVAFPPLGEVARPLVLDRRELSDGRAVDVEPVPGGPPPVELLDVGYAVPGGELRVVGDEGEVLADSRVGHVEFRGPNVAGGYSGQPEETARTFADGWLRTGDLGFLRRGRLCVTGRAKDVVFVAGQKFHACDLEQVALATPGAPPGRVAVVGRTDPAGGTERVAVFVTSRQPLDDGLVPVLAAVRARVREALGHGDVCVLPIPPEDFPRTTSGKVQRSVLRERLTAGRFAALEAEVAARMSAGGTASAPPSTRSGIEERITRIWAEVLGVPASSISRDDRFLAVGGSSLAALHVLAELETEFGGPLPQSLLRNCATVAALAEELAGVPEAAPRRAEPAPREVEAPPPADPAAVVGMACRLPDADTPEAFWRNLCAGRDSVTEVPSARWRPNPGATARWGAFLDDVAGFDAGFFGLDAAEAGVTDPHARIFLEVAHEALERAGYAGERRRGRRIGVFVAVGESGYPTLLQRALDSGAPVPPSALVGNLRNLIAARVAHHLDLSGPVLAVDTACSSALVALHLARRSLEAGECDAAVVGGVSLNLTPTGHRLLEAAQALSPTGRCRAFSSAADGFVPGEGAAALVLEPLSVARAAGDPVLAVVRGSTVNNDGRSLSLMAPNPQLQEAVIARAYRDAGIDPATVSYVEAHGTGTAIGDPIEARSLMRTFPAPAVGRRWLGSVKTNVGHLLNSAGMPSLVKVVLSLSHRALPPTLHHEEPSAAFDLAAAGLEVVREPREWTGGLPLRAGVNGFGFGGTNAHVILEEAPRPGPSSPPPPGPHLLTLSAATGAALRAAARELAAHVRAHPHLHEADLVRSASTARDHRPHRLALTVDGDLADRLEGAATTGAVARRRPRTALLFSGQGTQVPGLGRALRSQPVYRQVVEELSGAAGEVRGRSLLAWSLDDVEPGELARTDVAQPLLVAHGIALAAQLRAWGVRPDAVAGHSVGELAAAAVAGALDPREAVRFAAERGRLMQERCAAGAMAAVDASTEEVREVLAAAGDEAVVAAVNGPSQVVVSGPGSAVDAVLAALSRRGLPGRRLAVSRAFHSPGVDPALDGLRSAAARLAPGAWRTPLLSTVSVQWNPRLDAAYLLDHARSPVLFHPVLERLLSEGYDTLVTVGPGAALCGLVAAAVRALQPSSDVAVLSALGSASDGDDDAAAFLGTVGRLWERGAPIHPPPEDPPRPRVPVPTYPFQRVPHWLPGTVGRGETDGSVDRPPSALLRRFDWRETPLPAGAVLASVGLVGAHPDLVPALSRRLTRRGIAVHTCALPDLAGLPDVSVLVVLAGPSAELDDVDALDASTRDAAGTVLPLARFLAERPVPLLLVTEDVAVTGAATECARPGQAVLAGLALALPEEVRRQPLRLVDLSSLDDTAARLDALVRELDAPPAPGPAESVAWRGGRRLSRVPLAAGVVADRPPLPADGCYLITGGAGGVGAALARALADRGVPDLHLVGRTARPPGALVAELAAVGARVRYHRADLSQPVDVAGLVDALPRLDGVLHAAGLLEPGTLASTSVPAVAAVCAPKVQGTLLLARALDLAGNRPGAFVALSSIASVLPGHAGGLGAYAAANSFLDAFAAAEAHAGRPMQVLNLAAWTGTGMADSAAFRALAAVADVPQVDPQAAAGAVLDAPSVDAAQLLVRGPEPVGPPLAPAPRRRLPPVPAPAPAEGPPLAPASADRTARAPRDVVAGLIAAELGRHPEDLDEEASLLTMGLDSLAAVDLVRRLERELGRELPTTLLFEHPSIAQLSAHLAGSQTVAPGPSPAPDAPRETGPFPLTPVQLAFHTSGLLHPDVPAYAYLRQTLTGGPDPALLARSLSLLQRRHPMLRLRIRTVDGRPRQEVEPPGGADWPEWFEVRSLTGSLHDAEDALCNRVLDLATGPPLRAVLLREDADRASLLLLLHHAAADGASLNLLCAELWRVYTALSQHRPVELPALPSTFRDHADLVATERRSGAFVADLDHWGERLRTPEPVAEPPCDGDPDEAPAPPLTARQFGIDAALTAALRTRAAALDVSLFHLVLAAFARTLAGRTGRQRVTVNVARAGRGTRLAGIGGVVGPFADTLPLSVGTDVPGTAALAPVVRAAWRDAEEHGSVSSLDLARLLPAAPGTAVAGFSFARFPAELPTDCPVRIVETAARTASAATGLSLLCWEFDGALRFSWNHPARLFTPATLERLSDDLLAELVGATRPDQEPAAPGPGAPEDSLALRIARQCRRAPEAVAVEHAGTSLSYGALDRAARRLSARLRVDGTGAGDRVALLTPPGPATVIGLLGILYSGAAWVPLDPTHPPARLRDLVDRAHATTVVCDSETRCAASLLAPLRVLEVDSGAVGDAPDAPPARPAADDIAYVTFTSGTTGRPKGVPITHRAVSTYLGWAVGAFGYRAGDRMLATASICFDASVRQLLAPLLVGATVVTASREAVRDPRVLLDLVEQGRVTVWSSVPTLWEQLLRTAERQVASGGGTPDLSALRWVHVGGEALSPVPVRRWFDLFGPAQRIVNLYGPTEATVNATCHVVDRRPDDAMNRIPIGFPVAGAVVDVVGPNGAGCAAGEPGELWVAGPGLTPGYLDDPEQTERAFPVRDGLRWYRTGDRVARRDDGALEFLGRTDEQVKVRGHRVEPGEAEAVLREHPAVERAAVVAQPAPDGRTTRLVGYVLLRGDGPDPTAEQLRAHLAERLPDYLVPARLAVVGELPLTATGKLDRARLPGTPAPAHPQSPHRTPPRTPTEQLVASVWQRLLGVAEVSREDDFFALGGDSIGVLEVFAQLEPHRPALPAPGALHRHRTLAGLAAAVDAAEAAPAPHRPRRSTTGPFPLSASQRGFLLAEALSPGARTSWLACFSLTGELDAGHFQTAVDRLVQRHPMLRTAIAADRRPPVQEEVDQPARIPVRFRSVDPGELAQRLAEERAHRLDASSWPLARLQVLRTGPGRHALVVHAHHLLGDGYSAVVLVQDLLSLYDEVADGRTRSLPPLRSTFRDHVELLRQEGGEAAEARAEAGPGYVPPVLRRPEAASAAPGRTAFTLDHELTVALRDCAAAAGATPFAPVLAAYHRALARLTGQADLLLGVAVAGRDHALPDVHRVVGPFATVVPVRLHGTAASFPAQVREVAAAVDRARGDGATIRQRVRRGTSAGSVSSFGGQFLFSYLDFEALGPIGGGRLSLAWDEGTDLEPPRVGTDLLLTARPGAAGLQVTLRCSAGVLPPADLENLAAQVRRELTDAARGGSATSAARPVIAQPSAPVTPATRSLDAALVGYLPAPEELAARAGLPVSDGLRESIRSALFPDGRPRLLEELTTPLGRSGFLCLPVFADELGPAAGAPLARHVARAVETAARLGAAAVSLAGMVPAHTGYGFEVVRALPPDAPRVTTGHAVTAASVVATTRLALAATGTRLDGCTLAVVGLGSIGWSSLRLLLTLGPGAPARLLLCDVPGRAAHLGRLAEESRARGHRAEVAVCGPDGRAPAAVHEADLVIAAVSGHRRVLDVDSLRAGAIVVDDSFPHCFDPRTATRRMAERGDVVVVGGGLLTAGPSTQTPADDPVLRPYARHLTGHRIPGTVPSCQLEALVHVVRPGLPPVHGLVDEALALAHWRALTDLGVEPAPLHLLRQPVQPRR